MTDAVISVCFVGFWVYYNLVDMAVLRSLDCIEQEISKRLGDSSLRLRHNSCVVGCFLSSRVIN